MQQLGPGGKKLTLEAIRHRDDFRFRCRGCDTEFCCACMKMPYHLGFTCDQYNKYLTSRRCRFCKSQIQSAPPVSIPSISISISIPSFLHSPALPSSDFLPSQLNDR